MPATATGRGAQVILDGDAQAAARGVYAPSLRGNSDFMAALVNSGAVPDGSTADGSTSIGTTGSRRRTATASLMRTWAPASQHWAAVSAAVFTLSSQWEFEADYELIRFVYSNNTAGSYVVAMTKFAPTSAIGDGHSPVNAAGANDFTLFQSAYYNNAGLDVAPQDQTIYGSGTASFTVPANAGSLSQPTKWFSDWMRVRPLARTDGTLPLLCVRHLTDAAGTFRCSGQLTWANYMAGGSRRLNVVHKQGADNVTAPSIMVTPVASNFLAPDAIQYMTGVPGYSLLGVGDSLTKGNGSTSLIQAWGYMSALALSTPGRPISWYNQGWQGQQSSDFWANGYLAFKACKPNIVTIPVYSPNDGSTQATADLGWSRCCDFADYVARNGAVPVLMGPLPWGNLTTAAQDAIRLSTRTRMLNAAQYGQRVLDWEGVMGTGAVPNRILPGLLNADNLHPNDAGNALMDTAVFRPVLAAILGGY